MPRLAALIALACLALPCSALVVGRAAAPARPLAAGRALPRMMPSKEDKEFEEWVRNIANGQLVGFFAVELHFSGQTQSQVAHSLTMLVA